MAVNDIDRNFSLAKIYIDRDIFLAIIISTERFKYRTYSVSIPPLNHKNSSASAIKIIIMLFRFKSAHGIRHELSQAEERGTDGTDYPSLTLSIHFWKGFHF